MVSDHRLNAGLDKNEAVFDGCGSSVGGHDHGLVADGVHLGRSVPTMRFFDRGPQLLGRADGVTDGPRDGSCNSTRREKLDMVDASPQQAARTAAVLVGTTGT